MTQNCSRQFRVSPTRFLPGDTRTQASSICAAMRNAPYENDIGATRVAQSFQISFEECVLVANNILRQQRLYFPMIANHGNVCETLFAQLFRQPLSHRWRALAALTENISFAMAFKTTNARFIQIHNQQFLPSCIPLFETVK